MKFNNAKEILNLALTLADRDEQHCAKPLNVLPIDEEDRSNLIIGSLEMLADAMGWDDLFKKEDKSLESIISFKNKMDKNSKKTKPLTGKQIYERIRFVAFKRDLSIREATAKSGLKSPNTIYNYKYGAHPSSLALRAIAQALNTTTDYLNGKSDNWDSSGD